MSSIQKNVILKFTQEGPGLADAKKGMEELYVIDEKMQKQIDESNAALARRDKELQKLNQQKKTVADLATAFGQLSQSIVGTTATKALQDIANGLKNIQDLRDKIAAKKDLLNTTADVNKQKALNVEIQQMEKLLGNLQNIGKEGFDEFGNKLEDTGKKAGSLRQQLRQLREEIATRQIAGETGSELDELIERAGSLNDALSDVSSQIRNTGSDTRNIEGAIQIFGAAAGAVSGLQAAQELLGGADEDFQKVLAKLNALMLLSNAIQQIQNALQHESAAVTLVANIQRQAGVLVTKLQTGAESEYIVVRYAAVAAQRVLNAVMAASPAGLLLTVIGAVAAAVVFFTRSTEDASKAQKALNEEFQNALDIEEDYQDALNNSRELRNKNFELEGKSAQQIRERNIKDAADDVARKKDLMEQNQAAFDAASDALREEALNKKRLSEEEFKEAKETQKKFEKLSADRYAAENKQKNLEADNRLATQKEVQKFDEDALKQQEEQFKKDKETRDKLRTQRDALAERDRKAVQEQYKLLIQDQLSARDEILNNPNSATGAKLGALQDAFRLSKGLLLEQKEFDVNNDKLTGEEKKAVVAKYLSDLAKLELDYNKKVADTIKAGGERDAALTKEAQEKRKQAILENRGGQISQLQRDIADNEGRLKSERLTANEQLAIRQENSSKLARIARIEAIEAGELYDAKVLTFQEYEDKLTKANQDGINARVAQEEDAIKIQEQRINERLDLEQRGLDFLGKSFDVYFSNQSARYQEDQATNQRLYDQKLISQQEYDNRRAQLDKQQKEQQKLRDIIDIGIQTAKAIFQIEAQAAILAANPLTAAAAPLALRQIPIVLAESILSIGLIAAKKYKKGGPVDGPEGDDVIPALLTKREYVMPVEQAAQHRKALDAMRSGKWAEHMLNYEMPRVLNMFSQYQVPAMINRSGQMVPGAAALDPEKVGKAIAKHLPKQRGVNVSVDVRNGILKVYSDDQKQMIYTAKKLNR